MAAYYNEFDPYAAAWLRELIKRGHIADGVVDDRSITEVRPDDLRGFDQAHFFAGIGGWSRALRLAGYEDSRSVWTASLPCQPFSAAGKQRGKHDERHLWPVFFELVRECRPAVILGEQVASRLALDWLDHVFDDVEGIGYAAASAVLPAASVGAPHIRHRLWWIAVADAQCRPAEHDRHDVPAAPGSDAGEVREQRIRAEPRTGRATGGMADAGEGGRPVECAARVHEDGQCRHDAARCCPDGDLADAEIRRLASRDSGAGRHKAQEPERLRGTGAVGDAGDARLQGRELDRARHDERDGPDAHGSASESGRPPTFWSDCVWIPCVDGKARPTQPGIQPLAHGVPARVGRLRAAGNAIVPQVAAAFANAVKHYVTRATE